MLALVAFLLPVMVCADDAAKLPSRKASVVLPLLQQFSPKDSPKSVLDQIDKILDEADDDEGGGPRDRFHVERYYGLDNKTQIIVGFVNDKFEGISVCLPGQMWKELYHSPKN